VVTNAFPCAHNERVDSGRTPADVSDLLQRMRAGDADAAGALFTALQGELRALARGLFRSQRAGHTLQPTALVNEAFLKMLGREGEPTPWQDKAHFFAVAATAMRQILVNHARDRAALKRGGGGRDARRVTLSDVPFAAGGGAADVLDVEEALAALERVDPEQARIVELRFFGGLTNPEIAELLGRSLRAVELEWRLAKTWLASKLAEHGDG
jgi:RNA polymerase sigma-70 factor (ECF subfamily)